MLKTCRCSASDNVLKDRPAWCSTGNLDDHAALTTTMSETEHRYDILNPWIECRPTDNGLRVSPTALPNQLAYQQDGEVWWKNVHKIYIRVERNPRAEINKYVLPLFIIVLMATLAFGMDPADTNERLAVAMTAMIGVAQTKLSMPQAGDSNWLVLHSNCCLVMIMIVLVESLMVRPEFATEDTASWVDRGFFIGVAVLWVFPHAIVWCNISCCGGTFMRASWRAALEFNDRYHQQPKKREGEKLDAD